MIKRTFSRIVVLFVVIFSSGFLFGQCPIDDAGASYAYGIYHLDKKEWLVKENVNQRLISASLMKLVTTSTALEILGKDYQFSTQIGYDGQMLDDELKGDVIILSGGDPTLGSEYFSETKPELVFEAIFKSLKKAGVRKINGRIHVVDRDYSNVSIPASRLWEDIANYYGAIPNGLTWRDNRTEIVLASGKVGTVCEVVMVVPEQMNLAFDCRVIASDSKKDSAYVYGISQCDKWWIEGAIPAHQDSFSIKAVSKDPAMSFGMELKAYLQGKGINIEGNIFISAKNQEFRPLTIIKSPSLTKIIEVVNHRSNNLFADHLLLTMAKESSDHVSWDGGLEIIKNHWENRFNFGAHFRMKDGSGLSPKNLVTVSGMIRVLSYMHNSQEYLASMAEGGKTGTLKYVFNQPGMRGRLIGKSGSMEGVVGYSGYYTSKDGEKLAFCIIVNHFICSTSSARQQVSNFISQELLRY